MAVRTYIPGIVVVANYLKRYLARHSTTLIAKMGEGLYSVLVLVVDLVVILAGLIGSNSDANGTFEEPMSTLTSTQINKVAGAVSKFYQSNGVTGGDFGGD